MNKRTKKKQWKNLRKRIAKDVEGYNFKEGERDIYLDTLTDALSTEEGMMALANAMVEPRGCNMPKYVYTDEELEKGNFSWDN